MSGDHAEQRYKLCLRAEIVGLCIVIVIVWSLLLLPIIFYHIQPDNNVSDDQNTNLLPILEDAWSENWVAKLCTIG